MSQKTNYALCTLFDSNYLDKGLVLYNSLERYASDFTLYVLAMNDKCYEVLTDLNYEHLIPIRLADFENEDLLRVKSTRGIGEYCWTCSSSLIKYVLNTYQPDYCSYVDADMAFYADPLVLVDEMKESNASVSIVGHRFNSFELNRADIVGTYCVECNTFKNDEYARTLLDVWIGQCLEHCSIDGDGVYWADQKYMDNWVSGYDYVIETQNLGAGVAPWNIAQYKLIDNSSSSIKLKCRGNNYDLLFYHFENLQYLSLKQVNINVYATWGIDDRLVRLLYQDYLHHIDETKSFLRDEYGIDVVIKTHPGVTKKEKHNWKYNISCKRIKKFILVGLPVRLLKSKNIISVE